MYNMAICDGLKDLIRCTATLHVSRVMRRSWNCSLPHFASVFAALSGNPQHCHNSTNGKTKLPNFCV